MGKIKKDDLDALGEMTSFLGTYMNDFATKATAEDRRKIFKREIDPRQMMMNAVKDKTDYTADIIKDDSRPRVQQKVETNHKPAQEHFTPKPQPKQIVIQQDNTEHHNKNELQLEFQFTEQVIEDIGSIKDIINHFDKRLDKIEEQFKLINAFMIEIKNNTPKKRQKKVNEAS